MPANAGQVSIEIIAIKGRFDRDLQAAHAEAQKFEQSTKKAADSGVKPLNASVRRGSDLMSRLQRSAQQGGMGIDSLRQKMGRTHREVRKFNQANIKTTKQIGRFEHALRRSADSAALLTGPLGGVASRLSLVAGAASKGALTMVAFATAIGAVTLGLRAAIRESEKMQTSFFRTEAIVRTTGASAGLTAEQIRELSREIALTTLASTEGVERAAQKLLTFRSVQGDTFKEALMLSQDLAAVGFGAIDGAAVQLGKALEDPVQGIAALRRVGVSFSPVQKQQIKDFVEAGKVAEAQALILETLRKQVGGAGAAEAGGLAGAYDTLSQRIGELLENIGNTGPLQVATDLVNSLATAIDNLNVVLELTPEAKLAGLVQQRQEALERLQTRSFLPDVFLEPERELIAHLNRQIEAIQNRRVEQQKAENIAVRAAEVAREQAEADRLAAIEIERQNKAKKKAAKLDEQRKSAIQGLITEVEILTELQKQNLATTDQLAQGEAILQMLAQFNIDQNSEEARAIEELITKRDRLRSSIEDEIRAREQFAATTLSVQDEIVALNRQIETFGMAERAAETYVLKQRLVNEATMAFGQLTDEQIRALEDYAFAYRQVAEEADALLQKQQEVETGLQTFQQTTASALADVLSGTKSLGDAFKSLALSISQAVIQAQALKLVQSFTGGTTSESAFGQALASVFHSGGRSTSLKRDIPATTFINAPRFHNGLRTDEFPAILQRGEEVIPRNEVGRRRDSGITQVFNITTPDADSFRASQRQIARESRRQNALL